jgi:hypothetical protein
MTWHDDCFSRWVNCGDGENGAHPNFSVVSFFHAINLPEFGAAAAAYGAWSPVASMPSKKRDNQKSSY